MISDIRVQTADFDVNEELNALSRRSANVGAVASFVGIVRRDDNLVAMTLEHYPGMTEREIGRHVDEAGSRWPLEGITIVHRIGRLLPGARIVLVAVAGKHRSAAFEACRFLMDYLKTRAPFWKQEERADKTMWVDAKDSDDAAADRWRLK
jgi:molybdopterin synthase catalytic subunit